MKEIKQRLTKSKRSKKLDEFMTKWFPVKPIGILIEMKLNDRKPKEFIK
jgi:hypothetical protein